MTKADIIWKPVQRVKEIYRSSRQEEFWKKSALKNCSANLPASSVVKILKKYLRRTSFHLKMNSLAGIFKDFDGSV